MNLGATLAQRGVRVIAPSRFGYLRTPYSQDASPEAQADLFACMLDELGIERASIVGISAGANSALQFAIRHPARTSALILLVPAAYQPATAGTTADGSTMRERLLMRIVGSDFMFWLVNRYAHETAVRMVFATPGEEYRKASIEERARVDRVLAEILPISARVHGMLNDARLASHPPRYALEQIRAPALLISARDDLYGTYGAASYSARHISNACFIGFEHGGHAWLGHHAEVMSRVAGFVHKNARAATFAC
jgi:pimeloyl-ACP methyl ester carboxylesterase